MHALRVAWVVACVAAAVACSSTPKQTHEPIAKPRPNAQHPISGDTQSGYATWYGESQMTASGERFDKHQLTAAHRTLPFNTMVRVTNKVNGRSVTVRINDRGPYGGHGRIIDVSEAAARELQMIDAGVVPVTLTVVSRPGR